MFDDLTALLQRTQTHHILRAFCHKSASRARINGIHKIDLLIITLYDHPMNQLTGFQRDLLYCIAGTDDPYGLQIGRELEKYTSTEVNHGRLYPNLNTLVGKGLVEKQSKNDRTNLYTLTDLAIEHIEEHRQWENNKLQDRNSTADAQ